MIRHFRHAPCVTDQPSMSNLKIRATGKATVIENEIATKLKGSKIKNLTSIGTLVQDPFKLDIPTININTLNNIHGNHRSS